MYAICELSSRKTHEPQRPEGLPQKPLLTAESPRMADADAKIVTGPPLRGLSCAPVALYLTGDY
jgi:hypothetical protein